jgi:hypothetical protein
LILFDQFQFFHTIFITVGYNVISRIILVDLQSLYNLQDFCGVPWKIRDLNPNIDSTKKS